MNYMSSSQMLSILIHAPDCRYFRSLAEGRGVADAHTSVLRFCMEHTSEVMGLSWTQAGDGLLVSGKLGEIAMYAVPEAETQQPNGACIRHVFQTP